MMERELAEENLYLLRLRLVTVLFITLSAIGWVVYFAGWVMMDVTILFTSFGAGWYFTFGGMTLHSLAAKMTIRKYSYNSIQAKVLQSFHLILYSTYLISGGVIAYSVGAYMYSFEPYEYSVGAYMYIGTALTVSGVLISMLFSIPGMVCISVVHQKQLLLSYKEQAQARYTSRRAPPITAPAAHCHEKTPLVVN